jgi:hypothetical protein
MPSPGANERTSRSAPAPAGKKPNTLTPVMPIEQRREFAHVRRKGSDGVAADELDCEPHGSDIDDCRALHIGPRDAQTVRDRIEM